LYSSEAESWHLLNLRMQISKSLIKILKWKGKQQTYFNLEMNSNDYEKESEREFRLEKEITKSKEKKEWTIDARNSSITRSEKRNWNKKEIKNVTREKRKRKWSERKKNGMRKKNEGEKIMFSRENTSENIL